MKIELKDGKVYWISQELPEGRHFASKAVWNNQDNAFHAEGKRYLRDDVMVSENVPTDFE